MKRTIFAVIALAASAQQIEEKVVAVLPPAISGSLKTEGTIGEYTITDGDELFVFFTIDWTNTLTDGNFENLYLIQNYAQWPDEENTGKYSGVTCNTVYE